MTDAGGQDAMISKAEVRDLINDLFEEEALVIGGLVAVHEMDDDLVWRLVKNLDVIRGKILRRLEDKGGVISQDPLPAGTVYTAAVDDEARVGLFRLEVTLTAGSGKLRTPTGLERGLKESLNRAFSYLQNVRDRLGLTTALAQKDVYAEAIDLSGSRIECPCGVAFFAAMISTIQNRRVQAGTVILGDLTIQGNIKGPASIIESLQLAVDSGALRVLLPIANKSQFAGVPEDVLEKLDLVFYGDVDRAVLKTLEL